MQTQVKERDYVDTISSDAPGALQTSSVATQPMLTPATETEDSLQRISRSISDFFAALPHKTVKFLNEYKLPVISFALLVVTVIALRILLSVLNALNGIPFIHSFFQLIGVGYTFWFISQYLLKDTSRKELTAKLDSAGKDIFGENMDEAAS